MLSIIRAILIADSTLTDLVGSKIYPTTIPQESQTPLLLMEQVNRDPKDTKELPGKVYETDVQITAFTDSYDVGTTIMERVKTLLDDYTAIGVDQVRFTGEVNAWDAGKHAFTKTYEFKALQQ